MIRADVMTRNAGELARFKETGEIDECDLLYNETYEMIANDLTPEVRANEDALNTAVMKEICEMSS